MATRKKRTTCQDEKLCRALFWYNEQIANMVHSFESHAVSYLIKVTPPVFQEEEEKEQIETINKIMRH